MFFQGFSAHVFCCTPDYKPENYDAENSIYVGIEKRYNARFARNFKSLEAQENCIAAKSQIYIFNYLFFIFYSFCSYRLLSSCFNPYLSIYYVTEVEKEMQKTIGKFIQFIF